MDGEVYLDFEGYIQDMDTYETEINALGTAYARKPLSATHLPFDPHFDPDQPTSYSADVIRLTQRIVGQLCWLGTCHPAYASRHGM